MGDLQRWLESIGLEEYFDRFAANRIAADVLPYLTAEDRGHALGLSKALSTAKELIEVEGETDSAAVESAMRQVMESHHIAVDYAVIRHPHSLASLDCIEPAMTGGVVALVAGDLGKVRLIDNALLGC